jgi:hypothetical protein
VVLQRRLGTLLELTPQGAALLGGRPTRRCMPGLLLRAAEPVSCRRLSQRLSVASDTPKTPTASFLGILQSTAASACFLRPNE